MQNENVIKKLRICNKEDGAVFCLLRNVDKEMSLKDLRNFNPKRKITSDYEFIDKDKPINEDVEEDYLIEDFLEGDDPFIYVQKKSANNLNTDAAKLESAPVTNPPQQTKEEIPPKNDNTLFCIPPTPQSTARGGRNG